MPVPHYLPFDGRSTRHRVGTRTLDLAEWIELGPDADAQLVEKRELLRDRHDDVVRALPGSEAAGAELLEAVRAHVLRHFPDRYAERDGAVVDPRTGAPYLPAGSAGIHPVEAAARLVPEDLCLHLPDSAGVLRLVAAGVAFPSRWRLADKIGQPMAEIHAPVPRYAAEVGGPVDHVLGRLTVDRPLWRLNWSLHDDPTLCQLPGERGKVRPVPVQPEEVPTSVYLRVERQTLRRLPVHGSVVFTIRTFVWPLATMAADPTACARLAGSLSAMPDEVAEYKGMQSLRPAVLEWLTGARP